ncbi:MAG: Ig-like domain-containing protein [Lachnospiraceae bacterium]|nr:Ig-like domain-containing protein [Lachnospiraceae bacterium]
MKTVRKQILQRMLALVMTVCMVLGLIPTEPVKAETTGQLVIATNFELGDNGTVTWHNPGNWNQTDDNYASWNSQIDCNSKSLKVYFGSQTAESAVQTISPWNSNSAITGITIGYASEYTEGESGNNTTTYTNLTSLADYLTFEQPTYWMENEQGNGSNQPYADVVEIHFHKSGYYKFSYQGSSAYINVSLPTFGIYTQNTASWEALLDESYGYLGETDNVTLYAITNYTDENESSRTDFTLTCKSGEEEFKKITCTSNSSASSTQVYTLTFRPDDMEKDENVEFDLSYQVAESAEPEHEHVYITFVKRGLMVINPDWDGNNPYCSSEPFCQKSLEDVSVEEEKPVYLGIVGEDNQLNLISDIAQISVDDGLTIRQETDKNGKTIFYIQPSQAGKYTITCTDSGSKVSVNAVFPKLAFYKRAELSNDAYISDTADFGETDGDRTIYLIAREDKWLKLADSAVPVFSCDNNENSVNVAEYIDYEDVTSTEPVPGAKKVYQINLKWSHTFNLGVHLSYTEVEGSATEEIYSNPVHLNYKGVGEQEPEDDAVIRYDGDDGKDLCGFSGCFVTEEAYLTGRNWGNGVYPDQIFYWVHDTSIQNVVDRLLEAVDKEVELYDLKEEKTVRMKLPNTGYILLNMSYRDSTGKAAAQKEQYVYAPASVKGILMNSDVYVYSVPKTHAEGGYIEEEDTGNKIYDDVLEIPLTVDAKANDKGIATKLDGTTKDVNSSPDYIHGVWINVENKGAVIDEYGEEKLATFREMVAGSTKDDPKYLIRKTTYNESEDCWEKTDFYYVINRSDVVLPDEGVPVQNLTTLQAEPYRWPSLHVNASTHVRVQGLWASGAELYVGYYEGVDSVSTYVYDQTYTAKDIGNTYPVSYIWRNPHYNTEKEYCEETEETASVTVHVVKAESNTNINDNYSEGDKKAQIVVDKEAISDLIPLDNEQEKKTLIDGGRLDLDMSIDKVDTETAGEEVTGAVDQIKKNQGNNKNKQTDFVDINLKYVIKDISASGVDKKALTETETEMIVSLPLKDSMKNKKKYVVYRYHEGNVDILYAWIDEGTGNLCFETDQFSVYAIEAGDGETQTSTGSSTGGTSSGGTSSGSASTDSSKTQTKPDGTTVETSAETKMDGTKVETTVETKTDGTKTETVVETAKDGSVKTTETVTQADGSATKTEKENETNSKGKDVAVTTTTKTDATGEVTAITEKSVIAQSSATTSTTVTVEKDADGTIKDASANIAKTIASGNKATVAASIVAQIVEAAGTGDVQITMSVRDSDGKLKYKVEVSAEDLKAGEELYIYKRNTKTGEYTMVNAKTYEVSKNGNVAVSMSKKATYELVTEKQAAAINKEIRNTIKPKKSSATVEQGKTARFALSAKANPDNIKSIVYTTSKKSVATVSKNGKITAKGTGTVIIQAKVTLMNGQIKTIRMKLRVKEEL